MPEFKVSQIEFSHPSLLFPFILNWFTMKFDKQKLKFNGST